MSLEWSTLDNCFESPLTESNTLIQTGGDTSKPWLNFNEHKNSYRDDVFSPFFEKSNESTDIPTSKDELIPQPSLSTLPEGITYNSNHSSPQVSPEKESRSSSMDILKSLELNHIQQNTNQNTASTTKKNQYNQYDPSVKSLFPVPEGEKKKSTSIRDVVDSNSKIGNTGDRPISTRTLFPNHKDNNYNIHIDKASKKVVPNTFSSIPKFGIDQTNTKKASKPASPDIVPSIQSNLIEGFKSNTPADFIQSDDIDNQNKIWMVVLGIYISIMALIVGNNLRK